MRVVNVVDLMTLFPPEVHPHGMSESQFLNLFTANKPVIFYFHGSARARTDFTCAASTSKAQRQRHSKS